MTPNPNCLGPKQEQILATVSASNEEPVWYQEPHDTEEQST